MRIEKMMTNRDRYLYIDNLKLLMIILVVLIHLAVTYSGIGSWYLMDTGELDVLGTVFFGLFQTFTQAYFMGFLFMLSGYFVASSYDRKGCRKFLADRIVRLCIPALIYMLIISPFINYVLLGSMWERSPFFTYYSNYLLSLDFLGANGPMWFVLALFIFNVLYCLFRLVTKKSIIEQNIKMPTDRILIGLILIIFVMTFLIRLKWPIGTELFNMQLCFFSQYFILFVFGVMAGRYDWFSQITFKRSRNWLLLAFVPGILMWGLCMVTGGALDGNMGIYMGGMSWQSAVYALWESFIAVAMAVGFIGVFREKHNQQNRLMKIMSNDSFCVYMFHAPVIISVSLLLKPVTMYPIAKFLLAAVMGLPVCFLIAHFVLKKIPLLNKVL